MPTCQLRHNQPLFPLCGRFPCYMILTTVWSLQRGSKATGRGCWTHGFALMLTYTDHRGRSS